MNREIEISMNMPLFIQNDNGEKAVILVNKYSRIVCKYENGDSYYLKDIDLRDWYPSNRLRYFLQKLFKVIF